MKAGDRGENMVVVKQAQTERGAYEEIEQRGAAMIQGIVQ